MPPQVSDLEVPDRWQMLRILYWIILGMCFTTGVVLLSLPDQRQIAASLQQAIAKEEYRKFQLVGREMEGLAETAMKGFANAKNVDELIGFVADPERVGPVMKKFYAVKDARKRGFPVEISQFKFSTYFLHPFENHPCAEVTLFFSHPDAALYQLVWRMGDRAGVDWEFFAQYVEDLFEWFTSSPQPFNTRMHLYVERSEIAGKGDAPANPLILVLTGSSDFGYQAQVIVNEKDPIFEKISGLVPLGGKVKLYVELAWRDSKSGGAKELAINRILADNWGFNLGKDLDTSLDMSESTLNTPGSF